MDSDVKKRAMHRSKIIEVQFRGLQKMINSEAYCMDILTQNLAIQKSLASLNKLVLENHISTHITHMLASGDEKEQLKALDELMHLYELNNIRSK
jgi:DNA-binding FrmR family transcriptional regulator